MPIANYSTTVTVMKSIGEIQGMLVAHGAKTIMVNFDDKQEPTGLSFIIATQFGEIPFRLPANVKSVWSRYSYPIWKQEMQTLYQWMLDKRLILPKGSE